MVVSSCVASSVASLMMNGMCCMYQTTQEQELREAMRVDIRQEFRRQKKEDLEEQRRERMARIIEDDRRSQLLRQKEMAKKSFRRNDFSNSNQGYLEAVESLHREGPSQQQPQVTEFRPYRQVTLQTPKNPEFVSCLGNKGSLQMKNVRSLLDEDEDEDDSEEEMGFEEVAL